MKKLRCNGEGCTNVVLEYRPVSFGLAIVFCVDCATERIKEHGLIADLAKIGFNGGIDVVGSREDA